MGSWGDPPGWQSRAPPAGAGPTTPSQGMGQGGQLRVQIAGTFVMIGKV